MCNSTWTVWRLFARVKNHWQPQSIGKWLNKLWYIPLVLYTAAVKMKLVYAHFHDRCTRCMDKWKKQIAGQYELNFVKQNSNSKFCIPIYKTWENIQKYSISGDVRGLSLSTTCSALVFTYYKWIRIILIIKKYYCYIFKSNLLMARKVK